MAAPFFQEIITDKLVTFLNQCDNGTGPAHQGAKDQKISPDEIEQTLLRNHIDASKCQAFKDLLTTLNIDLTKEFTIEEFTDKLKSRLGMVFSDDISLGQHKGTSIPLPRTQPTLTRG